MPQMTRIRSTSVAAVGYDEDRHELSVRFVSGEVYVYAMVPPSVYRTLLAADSVGRFVNSTIKPTYPVRTG
jgi:KTSC domain-containing protein